jgi:hypothetical protein
MRSQARISRRHLALALVAVAASAVILIAASPTLAKKKHKKKKGLGTVVTVTATGNTVSTGGQVSTATASCSAGTAVIGGGFSVPVNSTNALLVFESYSTGIGNWTSSAINLMGTGAVTSYAYCRSAPKPILDQAGTNTTPAGMGATASASAACPAGTQLIGGGFQTQFSLSPVTIALPQASFSTAPGTWTVTGINALGAGPDLITAHAYCTTAITAPTILSATAALSVPLAAPVSAISPACPAPPKKKKHKKKKKRPPAQLLSAGGFYSPAGTAGGVLPIYSDSHQGVGGWLATAVDGNMAGTLSVTSQGICV